MKRDMVDFDYPEFQKAIRKIGITGVEAASETGVSRNYYTTAGSKGKIHRGTLELFCIKHGLNVENYIKKPAEPEEDLSADGFNGRRFSARIKVADDQSALSIEIFDNGKLLNRAYSKLKGNDKLSAMQAMSYAMHMAYKFEEQKVLRGGCKNG